MRHICSGSDGDNNNAGTEIDPETSVDEAQGCSSPIKYNSSEGHGRSYT